MKFKIDRKSLRKLAHSPYHIPIGIAFILYGLIAFITPATPLSWLFFIGLGFLGVKPFHSWIDKGK